MRWQQLTGTGIMPSPRQGAAMCEAEGCLWVMGGQANFVLDDLFTFDLATHVGGWRPLAAWDHPVPA
jgi:hypothetical protein